MASYFLFSVGLKIIIGGKLLTTSVGCSGGILDYFDFSLIDLRRKLSFESLTD